jgi:preprotein translocase subunit YajC
MESPWLVLRYGTWDVGFPMILAMAQPPGSPNPLVQLLPIVLVMAIFFFLVVLPMRRRQQKVQSFLSTLKVGDKVITSGGIYGTITKVEEQTLQLQIANNVRIEVARNAIVGYQGQAPVADKE